MKTSEKVSHSNGFLINNLPVILAALMLVLQLSTACNYGIFGDELYNVVADEGEQNEIGHVERNYDPERRADAEGRDQHAADGRSDAARKVEANNQDMMSNLTGGMQMPPGFKMPF